MAFDGNGTYDIPSPEYPAVAGDVIYAETWNTVMEDLAAALSNCITLDGQSTVTANIPMNSKKFTGLGNGSSSTDSVNYGQVFNSPAFVSPTAAASPAAGNDSLLLATTAWVNDIAFGTQATAAMRHYAYMNF